MSGFFGRTSRNSTSDGFPLIIRGTCQPQLSQMSLQEEWLSFAGVVGLLPKACSQPQGFHRS